MALKLDVSRTDDIAVVRCRGRIVFGEEADELRRVVLGLLNETQRIVLNLVWIEYIDSSGLGTLVASFISARNRGAEIKFAALSPKAQRVLTSTKVDRLFEVYDSCGSPKFCQGMKSTGWKISSIPDSAITSACSASSNCHLESSLASFATVTICCWRTSSFDKSAVVGVEELSLDW